MAYSDQQIRSLAEELAAKGAPPEKIRAFVASAVAERGQQPSAGVADRLRSIGSGQDALQVSEQAGAMNPRELGAAQAQGDANFNRAVETAGRVAVDAGIQGGGAAAGFALGGPVGAGVGAAAGDAINQWRRGGKYSVGQGAAAAIGGGIPIGAGVMAPFKAAGANIGAKAAETFIEGRGAPTGQELATAGGAGLLGAGMGMTADTGNATSVLKATLGGTEFRKTVDAMERLGYVSPPSLIKPTPGNNAMESVGGKADTAFKAIQLNAPMTTNAVRDEFNDTLKKLGSSEALPRHNPIKGKPEITADDFSMLNKEANRPYGAIAAVSPKAALALDQLKEAQEIVVGLKRAQVGDNYSTARNKEIDNAVADEAFWRGALEAEVRTNAPRQATKLLKEFEDARIFKAQIKLIENSAKNNGTGAVDGAVLGQEYAANPEYLTGRLADIGRVQNAFGRIIKDAANSPAPNVNKLTFGMGAAGATLAGLRGNAPLAAGFAAAPFVAPRAAQAAMFSPLYQKMLRAQTPVNSPEFANNLLRFTTQAVGR